MTTSKNPDNESHDPTVEVRHLKIEDYLELKKAMVQAYEGMGGEYWKESAIRRLLTIFPEGQICVTVDGVVVGCALALKIKYDDFGDKHTYKQITGNHSFNTHSKDGDVLYGIEVFIHPDHRGLRLGRRLYETRKELCENLNLRAIMAGGRIPGYHKYAHELKPARYIEKVRMRELYDPTLTFQLSNGFHVKRVLHAYLEKDRESCEYATLLAWNNIDYQEEQPALINRPKPVVRVGLVQWQMRLYEDLAALLQQVEFYVDAVSGYQADFLLFPEFFNAPLMAAFNHLPEAQAIREMADFTIPLRDAFINLAISYNVNIITGSMPIVREDSNELRNIAYLCRRDGSWDWYEKIHPTPSEVNAWGMTGGSRLQAFDTDAGRIGIMICYDAEFPELARLYADQGVQLLFVPFLTDTQNGYNRVRRCAQARAVENEVYVAVAGCVGNLPKVNNMDIQYGQSAIFTPSDFAFPYNAIKAQATANTETTIIADLDLDLLKELHERGSVRTLKDRRQELYELVWKGDPYDALD